MFYCVYFLSNAVQIKPLRMTDKLSHAHVYTYLESSRTYILKYATTVRVKHVELS